MSNVNNSKRVKLSSVESEIKPDDEDEATAVEENEPIAGCSHSSKQNTPNKDASVTVTAAATGTSGTAKGSDLVEDVLIQIFEMDFFDATDLLNFRLVNRSWRNCATSVLLKRSDCQISLNICPASVSVPSTDANEIEVKYVYCNNNNRESLLEDLNEIILKSPKFPCSNFRFVISTSSNNLFDDAACKNKIDTSSLHDFFSVYGNSVKSITVGDPILQSDLRSLLLNYTPCVECLDLQNWNTFGNPDPPAVDKTLFPESVILPNLKTLILGPCTGYSLMELVNAAINLESVENTNFEYLQLLLDHGKVGLIKKIEYFLHVIDYEEFNVFEKLAESEPKLRKLIVTAVPQSFEDRYDALPERIFYSRTQIFLNRVLESSKDTLKYLEFRICPFGDIVFPTLPHLECLKLVQAREGRFSTTPKFTSKYFDVLGVGDEDRSAAGIIGLYPNRPCDSFPNLRKLQLDIKNYGVGKDGSLLLLHTCRSHNRKIVPHVYESLKVVEIHSTFLKTNREVKSVGNLFQNVAILKLKVWNVHELSCSLWMVCPLVKSIEIYGISHYYIVHFTDMVDYVGSSGHDAVGFVDSLFTGFPIELCNKLKEVNQFPMEMEGNPSLQNFMRLKPSMCDLKHLTDFKIVFRYLDATFASRVTGSYAFQSMPRTTVTFAHPSSNKCQEGECAMDKYLAPISTFVHFNHQNLPSRFQKRQ